MQLTITKNGVEIYRLFALKHALKLELTGTKHSKINIAKAVRKLIGSKTRCRKQLLTEYQNYLNKM